MPERPADQIERLIADLEMAMDRRDLSRASKLCSRLHIGLADAEASSLEQAAAAVQRSLDAARSLRLDLKHQLKDTLDKRQGVTAYQQTGR